jgi:hypothetical protein
MLIRASWIRATYSPRADTYAAGRSVRYSVFAEKEFYEVRALACNVIPGRSYEARIHLPRTPVNNKGMKKKRRKGRDIVAQTPASTKRHRALALGS